MTGKCLGRAAIRAASAALLVACGSGRPSGGPAAAEPGALPAATTRLTVTPSEVVAGTYQRLHFTFTVGMDGLPPGGRMRFELPVAYGETEFVFWSKPQTALPDGAGFVRAEAADGRAFRIATSGISGGIVEVSVADRALVAGAIVRIEYRGIVQSLARDVTIRAEVRAGDGARWQPLQDPPVISVRPRDAEIVLVVTPADLARGEPFDAAVVLLDRFGNRAAGFRESVTLTSTDPRVVPPPAHSFGANDGGVYVFRDLHYATIGFQRLTASAGGLRGRGNYAFVADPPPAYRRYFGDTHFHTGAGTRNRGFIGVPVEGDVNTLDLRAFTGRNLGGDHRGNFTAADDAYRYVRDVMRLDFAAATEHDAELFDSLAWERSQELATAFHDAGRFTTFYGYEWTGGVTHHIVLYAEPGGRVFDHRRYGTLPALWAALDGQSVPALTIPHVTWPFPDHTIWEEVNDRYRRVGEIYSLWNGRFLVQPDDDPQRFELGADRPWSYQYAWGRGHRLGVVGATDNHLGQPGINNFTIYTRHTGGLAAVVAPHNDRAALWSALSARHTYATTGTRIYLHLESDGHPMGSVYRTAAFPTISGRVAGTNVLKTVELVKHDTDGYRTVYLQRPGVDTVTFRFTDRAFHEDSFYYLRVTQVDEYPGRPYSTSTAEMAWSSPIWVRLARERGVQRRRGTLPAGGRSAVSSRASFDR